MAGDLLSCAATAEAPLLGVILFSRLRKGIKGDTGMQRLLRRRLARDA